MVMPLFNSCNKFDVRTGIENNKRDVFEISTSAPKAIQKVIAELKRQNELTGFLKDFVVKEGYPLWDKSIYQKVEKNNPAVFNSRGGEELADTVVYTPIALLDSNSVNGFLLSKFFGDSVELHLYRAKDYDLYPYGKIDGREVTAERITLTLMELEKNIYGQRKYKIQDSNLFKIYRNDTFSFPDKASVELMDYQTHLKVVNYCVRMRNVSKCNCEDKSNCDFNQGCNTCGYDFCFSIGSEDPPTGGGGSNGGTPNWPPDPPTNPGGGGGNNPPEPTNCTGVNECRPGSQIVEGKVPCGGCGSGPITPIPIDEDQIDVNGFYNSRLTQLDSLLNADKFAIVPCDSLTLITMQGYGSMFQDVASYTASPYVLNRLDSIRNIIGSTMNWDNWNIQSLYNADGAVVNCDYFPIQINSFPINNQTAQPFTPAEFLEYFRLNIDSFITAPVDVSFNCNFDVQIPNTPPGTTWNDCNKFNHPYSQCVGAVLHINIPGPLGTSNDGSIIISDYKDTTFSSGVQSNYFTVSTLETPFDHEHPVAGNRRFGIFNTPAQPNKWTFYTMGVDRVWDVPTEIINDNFINGMLEADKLWSNVLGNVSVFINKPSGFGNANFYNQLSYIARPNWIVVEKYLKKQIDLQALKYLLGC